MQNSQFLSVNYSIFRKYFESRDQVLSFNSCALKLVVEQRLEKNKHANEGENLGQRLANLDSYELLQWKLNGINFQSPPSILFMPSNILYITCNYYIVCWHHRILTSKSLCIMAAHKMMAILHFHSSQLNSTSRTVIYKHTQ